MEYKQSDFLPNISLKEVLRGSDQTLERDAKEHIIMVNAMREILLNDTDQSYAVNIEVGNKMLTIPICCNHKLADFLLLEIEEAEKALRGEDNIFE